MATILNQPPTDYEQIRGSTHFRETYFIMFDYSGTITEIQGRCFQTLTWKNQYGRIAYW